MGHFLCLNISDKIVLQVLQGFFWRVGLLDQLSWTRISLKIQFESGQNEVSFALVGVTATV